MSNQDRFGNDILQIPTSGSLFAPDFNVEARSNAVQDHISAQRMYNLRTHLEGLRDKGQIFQEEDLLKEVLGAGYHLG